MRYKILALQQWRSFCTAVQILTRFPTPKLVDFNPNVLDRSLKFFPLIGLLVGGLSALVLYGASFLWREPLPALLALGASLLITGALHEDGLADFCDALGAFDRDRRLQIMKDSRVGVYGVLALVMVQSLKIFALASFSPLLAVVALILAHAGGRFATICVMAVSSYVGDVGAAKIRPLSGNISLVTFVIAAVCALLPCVFMPRVLLAPAYGLGAGLAALLTWRAKVMLGGYTGDVLGAVEQCFEVGFLLGAAAVL